MDIGITTPGGSRVSTTRIIYGKISIPSAGVVESIHPYTDSNNANQTYDAAIYADNGSGTGPGALIGSTGELSDVTINFDSPQFLEIPAQTPIAIPAAGTYWWAFVADNSSNVGMYHVAGAASNVRSSENNGWSSKWPDPPDVSGPTLTSDLVGFVRFTAAAGLDVGAAAHGHVAGSPTLSLSFALNMGAAVHGHTSDAPEVVLRQTIAPASSVHGQAVAAAALLLGYTLNPASSAHGLISEALTVSLEQIIEVVPALHAHAARGVALSQSHLLIVSNALHAQIAQQIKLLKPGDLSGAELFIVKAEDRFYVVAPSERYMVH